MIRTPGRALAGFLLLALLPASSSAQEATPAEETKPLDRFLLGWAEGTAKCEWDADLHGKYPRSPHAEDSRDFEATAKSFSLRTDCGAERSRALVDSLFALLAKKEIAEDCRLRVLKLLGWTQDPRSVPVLVKASQDGTPACRARALDALGLFGAGSAVEEFTVFGGRFRKVVFPPAPCAEASRALLDASRSIERKVDQDLRPCAVRGICFHVGPEIAARAREGLESKNSCLGLPWWDFADLLSRNAEWNPVEMVVANWAKAESPVRRAIARFLGTSASPKAVPVLLDALADPDEELSAEAVDGLHRLAGEDPPAERPEPGLRTALRATWEAKLGASGEKVDAKKALRFHDPEPGVYRVGR